MVDPVGIAGLSLQVARILFSIGVALHDAHRDGKLIHQSLAELQDTLNAVSGLTESINRLFSSANFREAFREAQREINVDLVHSLERTLESCAKESQKLLDILTELGLQLPVGSIKRTYLQWRLDRRLDNIDRIKNNFQAYRGSFQIAFQALTMCQQIRIAERDARTADELKQQISELQKGIEQISNYIAARRDQPADEEQTQMLDDMQEIRDSTKTLRRQATQTLEDITSSMQETVRGLYEESASAELREKGKSHTRYSAFTNVLHGSDVNDEQANLWSIASSPVLRESTLDDLGIPTSPSRTYSGPGRRSSSATFASTGNNIAETAIKSNMSNLQISGRVLGAEEFEHQISALLASAADRKMGIAKPFSDELMDDIAQLLGAVNKQAWSERPRTYLVLRLIDEVKSMDTFVLDGLKDIDFPYDEKTIPACITTAGARHDFLQRQRFVLSSRSIDLVRGGRHRHLVMFSLANRITIC
ncbi:hypothetical protein ACN47E_001044 [Coniothyrium glycines]